MNRARILLADDHTIIIEGLRSLLGEKFNLVGAVTDGIALIEAAKSVNPDIILLNISMSLLNGIEADRILKKYSIKSKLIFLTMHTDSYFVKEAFRI